MNASSYFCQISSYEFKNLAFLHESVLDLQKVTRYLPCKSVFQLMKMCQYIDFQA